MNNWTQEVLRLAKLRLKNQGGKTGVFIPQPVKEVEKVLDKKEDSVCPPMTCFESYSGRVMCGHLPLGWKHRTARQGVAIQDVQFQGYVD